MKSKRGKVLRDIPSAIEGDFFFREGEIVRCGYHTEDEQLSEVESEYIWAENFGWNPANSLDFLTADDVEIIGVED